MVCASNFSWIGLSLMMKRPMSHTQLETSHRTSSPLQTITRFQNRLILLVELRASREVRKLTMCMKYTASILVTEQSPSTWSSKVGTETVGLATTQARAGQALILRIVGIPVLQDPGVQEGLAIQEAVEEAGALAGAEAPEAAETAVHPSKKALSDLFSRRL